VPEYPRQARRHGWQGVVDLRLRLDDSGRVTAVEIARESGFSVLDDAAVAAARRSRFQLSGRRAGQGYGSIWGQMRYRFELGGG
jgi:TonB family protein